MKSRRFTRLLSFVAALTIFLTPLQLLAQGSRIEIPRNKYSVSQDVQLGQQASAEVRQQLPLLPESGEIDSYVERVGQRLVAAIPREFQQPQFRYEFTVVNARDINAFALPGGPMYVNRGMIEAARTEGEMAGVMAHEISHVALRHGTAQATKTQKLQLPAIGGAILGAIIGGGVGSVISQGTQIGLSAYATKYSREYETQADLLGAQIMARAGYDPRDLANMFRTIERESGGRSGPEWLSSHPNPGNRYERINQEANLLRVESRRGRNESADFSRVQALLRSQSPAPTMQEIAQNQQRNPQGGQQYPSDSRIEQSVERPSTRYRTVDGGNAFRISVPENWRQFGDSSSITFAPQGAYGNYQGQSVFTHGAIVGVANTQSRNLQQATEQYINSLLQSNSYLQPRGNYRRSNLGQRNALTVTLAGRSPVTRRNEIVNIYTALLSNGQLFYVINVAPDEDYREYQQVFLNMLRSVELG